MKTSKNIMGTISFTHKFQGMRKEQDFIVYPITASTGSEIMIQSDTRIAMLNIETGVGRMSKAHSSGAYGIHLSIDKLSEISIDHEELFILREAIKSTAGFAVGSSGIVTTDNICAIAI